MPCSLLNYTVVVAVTPVTGHALLGVFAHGPLLNDLRGGVLVAAEAFHVFIRAYRLYLGLGVRLLHLGVRLEHVSRHMRVNQSGVTLDAHDPLEDAIRYLAHTGRNGRQVGVILRVPFVVAPYAVAVYDRYTVFRNLYNPAVGKRPLYVFDCVVGTVTKLRVQTTLQAGPHVTLMAVMHVFVMVF